MAIYKEITLDSGFTYNYIKFLGTHVNFINGTEYTMEGWKDEDAREKGLAPAPSSKKTFKLTEKENEDLQELIAKYFYEHAKKQDIYKGAIDLI